MSNRRNRKKDNCTLNNEETAHDQLAISEVKEAGKSFGKGKDNSMSSIEDNLSNEQDPTP